MDKKNKIRIKEEDKDKKDIIKNIKYCVFCGAKLLKGNFSDEFWCPYCEDTATKLEESSGSRIRIVWDV